MTLYHKLNDSSILMEERMALAWEAMKGEYDPTSEDGVASKCWLTYRAADGLIDYQTWLKGVFVKEPVRALEDGLTVRWKVSHLMADTYAFLHFKKMDMAMACCEAIQSFDLDTIMRWPQVVINVLRSAAIHSAYLLNGTESDKAKAGELCVAAVETWQCVVGGMDWRLDPPALIEIRDQLGPVYQLICIGRAAGTLDFPSYPWMQKAAPIPAGMPLFVKAMKDLQAPTW